MRPLVLLVLLAACAPDEQAPADTDSPAEAPHVDEAPVFTPLDASGEVVERVEPARYLGAWYEIGTFVIPFQSACTGSTAAYGAIDPQTISVRNRCLLGGLDGDPYVIEGTATIENDTTTRLSVSFFGTRGAPYWVVELDGQEGSALYDWAVVSGPGQASLWILHRTPTMGDALLAPIVDRLSERGYDVGQISWTVQPDEAFPIEDVTGAASDAG